VRARVLFFLWEWAGWYIEKLRFFPNERDGYECIEYDKVLHFELETSVAHLLGSFGVCRACEGI